jgi:CDP-paratose 2-epimerase
MSDFADYWISANGEGVDMRWLVTGGAGFIGTNLTAHLVELGHHVTVIDDLSRAGVDRNADFLQMNYRVTPKVLDISESKSLESFLDEQERFDAIAHLAGQVSLLSSIQDPRRDFEVNALGTLNILEYVRTRSPETAVIGMSSNKVYGDLNSVRIDETPSRFVAPDWPGGFDESLPLEFHGPYGCSKGTADQYLADYARTFNMRTASLRQSSVYGPHQHPRSDQGWVAQLIRESFTGEEIQLNGIGKQVRDLLHARDLAALIVRLEQVLSPAGVHQLNVGGGVDNAMSILELFDWIQQRSGTSVDYRTGPERPSDQKVFISANTAVSELTGWRPTIGLNEGLAEVATHFEAQHRS